MLLFSLCKKKRLAVQYMNRPLFPTTLSLPSYDIGKSAPPPTTWLKSDKKNKFVKIACWIPLGLRKILDENCGGNQRDIFHAK
jgi:hypothetical protein